VTPADEALWAELVAKKQKREAAVHKVEAAMKKLAASAFREHLKVGKWTLSEGGYLEPSDKEAGDALTRMLAVALKLGYSGSFTISDRLVCVEARVRDDDLSIRVASTKSYLPAEAGDVVKDFRRLEVDVDLDAFLVATLESALDEATEQVADGNRRIEHVRKMLAQVRKEGAS
jgi:hypothetical protein